MKKHLLPLLMAVSLSLLLTACGNLSDSSSPKKNGSTPPFGQLAENNHQSPISPAGLKPPGPRNPSVQKAQAQINPGRINLVAINPYTEIIENADRTKTAQISMFPRFFLNNQGKWQKIDTSLINLNEDKSWKYANLKNGLNSYFAHQSGQKSLDAIDRPMMRIEIAGQHGINWRTSKMIVELDQQQIILEKIRPVKANLSIPQTGETRLSTDKKSPVASIFNNRDLKSQKDTKNTVHFYNNFNGVSEEYRIGANFIKHSYILHNNSAFSHFNRGFLSFQGVMEIEEGMDILVNGHSVEKEAIGETITITNKEGDKLYYLTAPFIYETANRKNSVQGRYRIVRHQGKISIFTQTPITWLQEKRRKYPIIVDPTIIRAAEYTGTIEKFHANPHWKRYVNNDPLLIQNTNISKTKWFGYNASFAEFNTTSIPDQAEIVSLFFSYKIFTTESDGFLECFGEGGMRWCRGEGAPAINSCYFNGQSNYTCPAVEFREMSMQPSATPDKSKNNKKLWDDIRQGSVYYTKRFGLSDINDSTITQRHELSKPSHHKLKQLLPKNWFAIGMSDPSKNSKGYEWVRFDRHSVKLVVIYNDNQAPGLPVQKNPENDTITREKQIVFSAQVNDPDGHQVRGIFEVNGSQHSGNWVKGNGLSSVTVSLSSDKYHWRVRAQDNPPTDQYKYCNYKHTEYQDYCETYCDPEHPQYQYYKDYFCPRFCKCQTMHKYSPWTGYWDFTVDYTPPNTPEVSDEGQFTTSQDKLKVFWSKSKDKGTRMDGYEVRVFYQPPDGSLTLLEDWTWVGKKTKKTYGHLILHNGYTYYFQVRAKDKIGNWSDIGQSDGITVDYTAPTTPVVIDEGTIQKDSDSRLSAEWSSLDIESSIKLYRYAISTCPNLGNDDCTEVLGWTNTTATQIEVNGLNLKSGKTYYFKVQAKNHAGIWSNVGYSDGILIDYLPPADEIIPPQIKIMPREPTTDDDLNLEIQNGTVVIPQKGKFLRKALINRSAFMHPKGKFLFFADRHKKISCLDIKKKSIHKIAHQYIGDDDYELRNAFSKDGKYLYALKRKNKKIVVLDVSNGCHKVVKKKEIDGFNKLHTCAINGDGTRLFCTERHLDGHLVIIDVKNFTFIKRVQLDHFPKAIVWNQKHNQLITCGSGYIDFYNPSNDDLVRLKRIPNNSCSKDGAIMSADGKFAYFTNHKAVVVVDTKTMTIVTTIYQSTRYFDVAPDNSMFFIANGHGVHIYRMADHKFIGKIKGKFRSHIVSDPSTGNFYVQINDDWYEFDVRINYAIKWLKSADNGHSFHEIMTASGKKFLSHLITSPGDIIRAEVTPQQGSKVGPTVSDQVTVKDILPNVPVLIAPADGHWNGNGLPSFSALVSNSGQNDVWAVFVVNGQKIVGSKVSGSGTSTATIPQELSDGAYSWYAYADNGSQQSENSESWNFSVDTSPPFYPSIKLAGRYTSESNKLLFTLRSQDWQSGVSQWAYAIRDKQGNLVKEWTYLDSDQANDSSIEIDLSLTMQNNHTYNIYAAAKNQAGIWSSQGDTAHPAGGITVDLTLPATPTVSIGQKYIISNDQVTIRRSTAGDPESGITMYQYAIGTQPGAMDVKGWTDLYPSAGISLPGNGYSSKSGSCFYEPNQESGSCANATWNYLLNTANSSEYFAYLITHNYPATAADFGVMHKVELSVDGAKKGTFWNWAAAQKQYQRIFIGTLLPGWKHLSLGWENNWDRPEWQPAKNSNLLISEVGLIPAPNQVTVTGLSLVDGQSYYLSLRAVNGAGISGSASSSAFFKVDASSPAPPVLIDDGDSTTSYNTLRARWNGEDGSSPATDPDSGILYYEYSIGKSRGSTDMLNWTNIGQATEVTNTNLTLQYNTSYFINVRATNGAGLISEIVSTDGIRTILPYPSPTVTNTLRGWNPDDSPEIIIADNNVMGLKVKRYEYRISGSSPTEKTPQKGFVEREDIPLPLAGQMLVTNGEYIYLKRTGQQAGSPRFGIIGSGYNMSIQGKYYGVIDGDYDFDSFSAAYLPFNDDFSTSDYWTVTGSPNLGEFVDGLPAAKFFTQASLSKNTNPNARTSSARVDIKLDSLEGSAQLLAFIGNGYSWAIRLENGSFKYQSKIGANVATGEFDLSPVVGQWFTVEVAKSVTGYVKGWIYPATTGRNQNYYAEKSGYPIEWKPSLTISNLNANFYAQTFREDGLGGSQGFIYNGYTKTGMDLERIRLSDGSVDYISVPDGLLAATSLRQAGTGERVHITSDGEFIYNICSTDNFYQVRKFKLAGNTLLMISDKIQTGVNRVFNEKSVFADGAYLTAVGTGLATKFPVFINPNSIAQQVNSWVFEDKIAGQGHYDTSNGILWAIDQVSGNLKQYKEGNWINLGKERKFRTMPLSDGNHQLHVRAVFDNNETSDIGAELILIDTTPPLGKPVVTAVDNLGYLGQNHQFTINWTTEQVKDDESGIFTFQVALGSTPGLADVNGWTDVGLVNTYTFAGLNLLPGATYYAMVRAVNSANLTGNSNSTKGTVIDLTPPSKPVIVVEGSKTFDLEKLHAQWFSVDHQDPKLTYRVTIRDSNDCSNVPDDEWMDMGPANGGTFMYNLELGSYYYICVQARNRAGFYSKISKSDGGVKGCRGTALNEFSDNFNNSDSISVGNYYNQWKNWYSQDEWTTLGIGGIQPKFASMGGIFGDDSPASNIITNGREDWVEASLYGQIIVFKPGAGAGFAFRFQDRRNYILFYQTDDGRAPNGMINQPGSYLYAIVDGTPNLIAERRDITFTVGLTHQVKIDTSDQYIRVWFDNDGNGNLELNELVFNENSKLLVHGAIGLYAYGSNSMIFDNISVTAKRGTVLMDIEPENEKIEWFIDTPPRIIGTPKDENGNEIKVPILEGKHFLFVGCRIVGKFIVTDCGELWEDPQNKLDPDFAEIIGDKMFFKYRFGDKTVCKTGGDSTSGQSLTALDYENGGNNQSSFDSSEAGSFSNTGLIDHFNIIKEGKFAAGSFNTLATGATAQLVAPPWLFKKAENILWEQISGDKAILSNTRAADPMIIAPKKPQELYFMLTGTRSNGKSISETVKLQVKASAPILTDGKVIRTDFPAALTAYRLQNVARIDIPQSITPALIPFTGLIDTASLPDFTKSTSPEEAPVRLLIDKNGIFKPVTAVFDFIKLPFHPEKPQFYLAVAPLEGWKKGYGYSLNITQKLKIFEQISISLPTQNLWQENAVIPLAIPK